MEGAKGKTKFQTANVKLILEEVSHLRHESLRNLLLLRIRRRSNVGVTLSHTQRDLCLSEKHVGPGGYSEPGKEPDKDAALGLQWMWQAGLEAEMKR